MRPRFHRRRTPAGAGRTPPPLPGSLRLERLGNGLTVGLLANPQAPIVTSALFYRAGTRDELPGHGGTAHFLEHMMFKGSAGYGPGEIDRRTQALGGSNNAFTSHDATAYYFNFAADRWAEALAIEADRMAGLRLDPAETASERQVILEEIAMYDSEPWDALELEVQARLFPGHPYGRPVLGTKEELLATGERDLAGFHDRFYRPDNAVLVVGGDLAPDALERVEAAFGGLPAGAAPRPAAPPASPPASLVRVTRAKGEVARILLTLPAPAATDPDHAPLRLLALILAGGRSSRLHRSLVDEQQICTWVAADLSDNLDLGHFSAEAEVIPGVEPERVEAELLRHLSELAAAPPGEEELARVRQIAVADWVFDHERVHQQVLAAGFALALFGLDHLERQLRGLTETGPERLLEVAGRWLRPEKGGVLGWSLPRA